MNQPGALLDAFYAYERALAADDLATLDDMFDDSSDTLRADDTGILVGRDKINEFRARRGGAPQRRVIEARVQNIGDDDALIVSITEGHLGGRGLQTQVWHRRGTRWHIRAAHVSSPPAAFDERIWRVVGAPLLPATRPGPLEGDSVAVKDIFAVAGYARGAGNPAWLASARPELAHASAVRSLLDAGASIRGIARTDEFAYGLSGTNAHYGTPPNPRAPHRVPGGSSSGPATAVASGMASIGLGTDTAGSIRVPAAYQGLWGLRPSHGAASVDGLLPLAPSFDTVGWLARDLDTLARVAEVLLPLAVAKPLERIIVPYEPDVDDDVAHVFGVAREGWMARFDVSSTYVFGDVLQSWLSAFQVVQGFEAWRVHGGWLAGRLGTLASDTRSRFEVASRRSRAEVDDAMARLERARHVLTQLITPGTTLAIPTTASTAPRIDAGPAEIESVRMRTLRLTVLASLSGLPAISIPTRTDSGLPMGICLIGARGSERALIEGAAVASSIIPHDQNRALSDQP